MPEQRPTPPEDLGEHGRALWSALVNAYAFNPSELHILAHAAREEDLIARLAAEAATADLIVPGYNGQPTGNPLVSELRQHRSTLASLVRQLKIPSESGQAESTSDKARRAAHARWRTTPAPRSS